MTSQLAERAAAVSPPGFVEERMNDGMVRESGSQVDLPMVTAYLHDGPCDGETIGMPWARYELELLRWVGDQLEQTVSDTYRLRPPWRGQQIAHFDYVAPQAAWQAV